MLTAIEHGSVGPKRMAKAISESKAVYNAKIMSGLLHTWAKQACACSSLASQRFLHDI